MKKSKLILIIIFLAAAAAILYFAYGVVRNRYFPLQMGASGTNSVGSQNQAPGQTENNSSDQSAGNQENNPSDNGSNAPQNGQPNIANSDCDNNCANLKDNAGNFQYCQEICGVRPVSPKDTEAQCASLSGLEQNACWRDLAVSKKDFSFCDKISDAKLVKVCRNRVTEEILN